MLLILFQFSEGMKVEVCVEVCWFYIFYLSYFTLVGQYLTLGVGDRIYALNAKLIKLNLQIGCPANYVLPVGEDP